MKFNIENPENAEEPILFNIFTYNNYEKLSSEDNTITELYYKNYLIYDSKNNSEYLLEIYHTPKGEYQVDTLLSGKQKNVKFVSNEFLEEEFNLTLNTNTKLSKQKENSLPYLLTLKNYLKKTHSHFLYTNGYALNEEDEKWKEFKKLEKRYQILNFSLPYLSIKDLLENIVKDITTYIVTRNFDAELFSSSLESLKIVDFTNVSVLLLESFMQNPSNCDIETLLKKFQGCIHNIDTIIKINTNDLDTKTIEELE